MKPKKAPGPAPTVIAAPKFRSRREEAEWWDSHEDEIAAMMERAIKNGAIIHVRAGSTPVTLRMANDDLRAARHIAARRGMPYQTYIKRLIREGIERDKAS